MKNILLFLFCSCFLSTLNAQYVIVDKDGFTNVRQQPTVESPILGKILKDQLFYNAMDNCEMNGMDSFGNNIIETENWMPVYIGQYSGVGYVYKKNIKEIYDFPQILPQVIDSNTIIYNDGNIKIKISFQNINESKYVKRIDEYNHYMITGEQSFPCFTSDNNYVIKEMEITWKNKVEKINDIIFYNYFFNENPFNDFDMNLRLSRGENGTYFLRQRGGDGGEPYAITYVIKDGAILYYNLIDGCSVSALNILTVE